MFQLKHIFFLRTLHIFAAAIISMHNSGVREDLGEETVVDHLLF